MQDAPARPHASDSCRRLRTVKFIALALVLACGRSPSSAPPSGPDASDASSAASARPNAEELPREPLTPDAGDSGPNPCLGYALEWTSVGGLASKHDKHVITGCRTYRMTLWDDGPRPTVCTLELSGPRDVVMMVALSRAMSDPSVVEAFDRGLMVGRSNTPHDGTNLVVTRNGQSLSIGRDEPAPLHALSLALSDVTTRGIIHCRHLDAGTR